MERSLLPKSDDRKSSTSKTLPPLLKPAVGEPVSASEDPMRLLEAYLQKFPIDSPESAEPLQFCIPSVGGTPREPSQDRSSTEEVEIACMTKRRLRRMLRAEGILAQELDGNRCIEAENAVLCSALSIVQAVGVDSDAKRQELGEGAWVVAEVAREAPRQRLLGSKCLERFEFIEAALQKLEAEARYEARKLRLAFVAAFDAQVDALSRHLEVVREAGQGATDEWRHKNEQVEKELEEQLKKVVSMSSRVESMREVNQKIHSKKGVDMGADATLFQGYSRALLDNGKAHKEQLFFESQRLLGVAQHVVPAEECKRGVDGSLPLVACGRQKTSHVAMLDFLKKAVVDESSRLRQLQASTVQIASARSSVEVLVRDALCAFREIRMQEGARETADGVVLGPVERRTVVDTVLKDPRIRRRLNEAL